MLWLDMGLGKTIVSLDTIVERLDRCEVWGCLVVGTKRIIERVWRQEAAKWEHTRSLRFSVIHGTPANRMRAAVAPADVYLVSYDNLKWLVESVYLPLFLTRGKHPPVNMVVFDEVSKLKEASTNRHKAIRKVLPYLPYRIGLTGTPASNGYHDLYGQYLAVDSGARLGTTKKAFRDRFFKVKDPYSPHSGFVPHSKQAEDNIRSLIADITVQMNNEDYLTLPPVIQNDIVVDLSPADRGRYEQLEREMFAELDSGHAIEAFNGAALSNRCLQMASGAIYRAPGDRIFEHIHDTKQNALDDVIEEAAGKPVLVLFQFRHEAERVQARYPNAEWIDSTLSEAKFADVIARWQAGQIPILLGHPGSMGHGLDELKDGPVDDLVWVGLTWSLDLYLQAIARLRRQGRTRPIRLHRVIVERTVDEVQVDVLENKRTTEAGLKAALNEYRVRKSA